jgi:tRNA C32,U32 (ribose-2'-O)-methylase TrmJ
VALVFGPEDTGLSRAELERCNPVVVVPCAPDHPTLNLAQAVLILAYEIHQARLAAEDPGRPTRSPASDGSPPAELGEIEGLLSSCAPLVHGLGFDQDQIHRSMMRDLRLLVSRAALSRREAGLLRRLIARASRVLGLGG